MGDERHDDPRLDDIDPTERQPVDRVDTEIGPYRLLEPLGRGAMGEVWRAEQHAPVKRIVALKLILKGMDTRELITRFEIERQAMALMNHPWIAKVLDAGETEAGRPWIAMEYIPGEKITDYCRRNELSIEDRLTLFKKVCAAIQHAHQNAVIHRDLKPGNILVIEQDGEPVPKIIDFGIAKATAQRLSDRSAATFVGQLIGTPLYMSPEQLEMSAAGVDTRADVYSLGVLLYELLVGVLPHDPDAMANAALGEVLKVLREGATPKPSTRLSTLGDRTAEIAEQRRLKPSKLVGKLRGDLDWIVLKSLDKDRKRRYDSPKDFADDIDRYLEHGVVEARPPSVGYRLSRFGRRNQVAVSVAGFATLALATFAIWQLYQNRIIAGERDRAIANERLSIARSYVETDPTMAVAHAISSLEVLDRPEARDVVRRAFIRGELRDEFPADFGRGNPLSVDASRDGRLLAVAHSQSEKVTVDLLDLESKSLRALQAPTSGFAYKVLFTRDGFHVAAVAVDGVHVWRVADGEHVFHREIDDRISTTLLVPSEDESTILFASTREGGHPQWYALECNSLELVELGSSAGRFGQGVQGHRPSMDPGMQIVLDYDGTRLFLQDVADLGTTRTRDVGNSEAAISMVALDPERRFAVSVDVEGGVLVFDLRSDSPELIREYQIHLGTGANELTFDPDGYRFLSAQGSPTSNLYTLNSDPPRAPVPLLDRTHWTHDGAFLADGSIVTARNGVWQGPLAHWRRMGPVLWSLDRMNVFKSDATYRIVDRGRALLAWALTGEIYRISTLGRASLESEVLGRTPSWHPGREGGFVVDEQQSTAVLSAESHEGFTVIDLESGTVGVLDPFDGFYRPLSVESTRKLGAFLDVDDVQEDGHEILILDLRSGEVVSTLRPVGEAYEFGAFTTPDSFVCLSTSIIVRFSLDHPTAVPDTLWRGDASGGARLLDRGRSMIARSGDGTLTWRELDSGRQVLLESNEATPVSCADVDATGRWLAYGTWRSGIRVRNLETGELWSVPLTNPPAFFAKFDPLGRWLFVETTDRVDAWKFPLDPIFSELNSEAFLDRCEELTNVRVVTNAASEEGFWITNLSGNWRK